MNPRFFLCLLLAALPAAGRELVTNGDFEQDLSVGWTQTTGGTGTFTLDRSTGYHPDPDNEAQVYVYDGAAWAGLGQRFNVSSARLQVSFDASFELGGSSSTCWPVAAVIIAYYDAVGNYLGDTRVYHHDSYCTWAAADTCHLIDVTNPGWTNYSIDVLEELEQNLPGIDPDAVAQVEVSLYDYTSGG